MKISIIKTKMGYFIRIKGMIHPYDLIYEYASA